MSQRLCWQTLVCTVLHLLLAFTVSPSQPKQHRSAVSSHCLSQIHLSNLLFKLRGEIWYAALLTPKRLSLGNEQLTEQWTYLYFQLMNMKLWAIRTVDRCLCPKDHTCYFTSINPLKNAIRKILLTFYQRQSWGNTVLTDFIPTTLNPYASMPLILKL